MKLTVEKNRDALRRYGHLKPAGRGVKRCGTLFPGTTRACTLERGHRGAHAAHGSFGKVLAVWDSAIRPQEAPRSRVPAKRPTGAVRHRSSGDGGLTSPVAKLVDVLKGVAPSMETAFFLIMLIGMVGFVLDWALRIAGVK